MNVSQILNKTSSVKSIALGIKDTLTSFGDNGWTGLNSRTTEEIISHGLSESQKLSKRLTISKNESTLLWVDNIQSHLGLAKSKIDMARATKYSHTDTPLALDPKSNAISVLYNNKIKINQPNVVPHNKAFLSSPSIFNIIEETKYSYVEKGMSQKSRNFFKTGNSGLVERVLFRNSNPLKRRG